MKTIIGALKARHSSAQGKALGNVASLMIPALKGRNIVPTLQG